MNRTVFDCNETCRLPDAIYLHFFSAVLRHVEVRSPMATRKSYILRSALQLFSPVFHQGGPNPKAARSQLSARSDRRSLARRVPAWNGGMESQTGASRLLSESIHIPLQFVTTNWPDYILRLLQNSATTVPDQRPDSSIRRRLLVTCSSRASFPETRLREHLKPSACGFSG